MKPDDPNLTPSPIPPAPDPQFLLRVARARHDLHNSIGHIHGFSELWLEELQTPEHQALRPGLELIHQTARRMIARTTEFLQVSAIESGRANLPALQKELNSSATRILSEVKALSTASSRLAGEVLQSDLVRIEAAARRIKDLAESSIAPLLSARSEKIEAPAQTSDPPIVFLPALPPAESVPVLRQEGLILVVDDLEENRELLSRRLTRLGYSVHTISSGEEALLFLQSKPVDLILLDILMPGLDGFEVLRRLKADSALRHVPVIMLSAEDQTDTVVHCIKLGADDFLPKPFNPTLLLARIESSLSKKRLRDQETAFLKRLQTEQDISERLLLNILPRPVAERLKQGEQNIADSFPQVTVLFTDFVNFTRAAGKISPKDLVTRLNEIFSKFDQLCDRYGLEKIKMIGDAYMAVAGVPTPCPNHAHAAAGLALAMHSEAARFTLANGQPCPMRIGINTGPVIAGVIGTKKFAYDLWGDTVNLASRMENHAPPGGILVTAETHSLIRSDFTFKPGRLIRVKGKGQVLTYLLQGKA